MPASPSLAERMMKIETSLGYLQQTLTATREEVKEYAASCAKDSAEAEVKIAEINSLITKAKGAQWLGVAILTVVVFLVTKVDVLKALASSN